ncbi:hypothetical protein BGZ60DRAFT_411744 [Tricladium varicosporioides]|nr:hypothetical protein BGZ60DRAFT_411744 [Hymenoscyphus varicosporioides]
MNYTISMGSANGNIVDKVSDRDVVGLEALIHVTRLGVCEKMFMIDPIVVGHEGVEITKWIGTSITVVQVVIGSARGWEG